MVIKLLSSKFKVMKRHGYIMPSMRIIDLAKEEEMVSDSKNGLVLRTDGYYNQQGVTAGSEVHGSSALAKDGLWEDEEKDE